MAVYQDREAFIPYSRQNLIQLCLQDSNFSPSQRQKFRDFCELLAAYYHFQLHNTLERLKENYTPFNPDLELKSTVQLSSEEQQQQEKQLVVDFQKLLEQGNYFSLSGNNLKAAFEEKSLIELKTQVNLEDFEEFVCYCRGNMEQTIERKQFFFWKKKVKVDLFQRVALLIKFKDESYFAAKNLKIDKLNFIPGKIYIYLYKLIPKLDLELLFPNVKISMTVKDRLLFGIPAIGAAIPMLLKIAPEILLILAVILYVSGIFTPEGLDVQQEQIDKIVPVLVAVLTIIITMGGFALSRYSNYKKKQIKFQKEVTEKLFYCNLANNAGVFQSLIDAAEEEECKEIILVYYHLLTSNQLLTPEQLDNRIETWMEERFGTKIDFDIDGPLNNLQAIRGKIIKDGEDEDNWPEFPLLSYDEGGNCHVLSLDDAKRAIDYVWDCAFVYS